MTAEEARPGARLHRCRRRWHLPQVYRYRGASAGLRGPKWNQYHAGLSRSRIGAYVVIGRYAYCVKWARLLPDGDQS